MKKSILTLLIPFAALLLSCGEEKSERLCELTCEDETVIEVIENVKGLVKGRLIDINPESIDKIEFALSNEYTLVPCNFNDSDKLDGKIVIISGKKLSCCHLISSPVAFPGLGCKFEITSIRALNDNDL